MKQKKRRKRRQIFAFIFLIAIILPFFHIPTKAVQQFVLPFFSQSSTTTESVHPDANSNKKPESSNTELTPVQDPDRYENEHIVVEVSPTPTIPPENMEVPEQTPAPSAKPEQESGNVAPVPTKTPTVTEPVPTELPTTTEPEPTKTPVQVPDHENTDYKYVALTFDDGPDKKYTPAILDILKQYNVKATFFVVGTQAEKHSAVLQRIVDEGHSIGNHTYSHADLTKLSTIAIAEEIEKADEIINDTLGFIPNWIRAPYGAINDNVKEYMNNDSRSFVGWNVDTRDWAGASVEDMRKNINKNTKPNSIILMHSFGGKQINNTVELLPYIIEDLQDKGYTLVTIDELYENKV